AKINGLKEGQTIAVVGLQFGLNVPQSHEKAYDQIIRMMEMSVDEEITLTCSQFACFVMDDWDWKEQWSASNATYLGKKEPALARRVARAGTSTFTRPEHARNRAGLRTTRPSPPRRSRRSGGSRAPRGGR